MPIHGRQSSPNTSQPWTAQQELEQLRSEVQKLLAEREELREMQRRIMELTGTTQQEKLIHDLRNILNERNLLRTLTEGQI